MTLLIRKMGANDVTLTCVGLHSGRDNSFERKVKVKFPFHFFGEQVRFTFNLNKFLVFSCVYQTMKAYSPKRKGG